MSEESELKMCECCQCEPATEVLMTEGHLEPPEKQHLCAGCYPDVKEYQGNAYQREFS